VHNTQPWRFRIGAGSVEVYADRHRRLEVIDPAGRELLISVGAAVFTLRLALRRAGYRTTSDLFPDADEPDLVARVAVAQSAAPTVSCEALAAAVPHRHTNRWPFAGTAVPAEHLDHLVDAARREGARLRVPAKAGRDAVLGLSQNAQRMVRDRPGYRDELARWAGPDRPRHEGVPSSAIGPWDALEFIPVRDFGELLPPSRPSIAFEPHPTVLILATPGDSRADQVRAGQALQRVLLTATWLDLATTPISQPIEVPSIRAKLADPSAGWWAQMVVRVGYGRQTGPTPRRSVEDVLLPDR
jgi:hypothetical protein